MIPSDIRLAASIANTSIDAPASLMTEADRNGVDGQSLTSCVATEITMVLTNGHPWWQIQCSGNPVLAEDRLRDAGFGDAFAGDPTKLWVRLATDAERTAYEEAQAL